MDINLTLKSMENKLKFFLENLKDNLEDEEDDDSQDLNQSNEEIRQKIFYLISSKNNIMFNLIM